MNNMRGFSTTSPLKSPVRYINATSNSTFSVDDDDDNNLGNVTLRHLGRKKVVSSDGSHLGALVLFAMIPLLTWALMFIL